MRLLVLFLLLLWGCASNSPILESGITDPYMEARRHCNDDWRKLQRHDGRFGTRVYYFPTKDAFGRMVGVRPSCQFIHDRLIKERVKNHGSQE